MQYCKGCFWKISVHISVLGSCVQCLQICYDSMHGCTAMYGKDDLGIIFKQWNAETAVFIN
jgi:hypothetical protein